mgnify:CR=1 FL=1
MHRVTLHQSPYNDLNLLGIDEDTIVEVNSSEVVDSVSLLVTFL